MVMSCNCSRDYIIPVPGVSLVGRRCHYCLPPKLKEVRRQELESALEKMGSPYTGAFNAKGKPCSVRGRKAR